jgi:ribosomal protein S27E
VSIKDKIKELEDRLIAAEIKITILESQGKESRYFKLYNDLLCSCDNNNTIYSYSQGDIIIACKECGGYKHLPLDRLPSEGNAMVTRIIDPQTVEIEI